VKVLRRRPWPRRAAALAVVAVSAAAITTSASEIWLRTSAAGHVFTEQTAPDAPDAVVLGAQILS
jgi:vancomycin permeability regulator SanA